MRKRPPKGGNVSLEAKGISPNIVYGCESWDSGEHNSDSKKKKKMESLSPGTNQA